MVVKLLSTQIPIFWESIKFCMTNADEVKVEDLQPYLNNLLHSLLSDLAQCFVRLDDTRNLLGVMVTKIEVNKITGKQQLCIQGLYSFKNVKDKEWQNDYTIILRFAKNAKCKSVVFSTRNKKVIRLGELLGFVEANRSFVLVLGGS